MRTLILDSTTKTIKVKMSGAPATTQPDFTASWADNNGTTFTEGSTDGALNGTTDVTLVSAPVASTRRIIKSLSIENKDTAAVTITVMYDNNGTQRNIAVVTLAVKDTWTLEGTYDTNGSIKNTSVGSALAVGTTTITGGTSGRLFYDNAGILGELDTATYPSLTEHSYVKGVTSSIQTQLTAKAPLASPTFTGTVTIPTPFTLGATSVTANGTELNYVAGVSSAIQTQINTKAPSASPTFGTSITGSYLTASEILITDGSKNIVSAPVATYPSLTELTYVKGVTSALQTQLGNKQPLDTQLTSLATLSYAGNTLKVIRVNAGETDFELATVSGGQSPYDAIVATSGGDYTDLESAIVAGKINIFVKPGTYTVAGAIDINVAGVNVTGSGWTTIFQAGVNLNANVFNITVANVKLSNFKIDGNSANVTSGNLVSLATAATQCRLENIWFSDGEDMAVIEDTAGRDNVITKCQFSGVEYTDVIETAGQGTIISNCTFLDTLVFATRLIDANGIYLSVTNCTFGYTSTSSKTGLDFEGSTYTTMTGCSINAIGNIAKWLLIGESNTVTGNSFFTSGKADAASEGSVTIQNGQNSVFSNNYLFQTTAGGDGEGINVGSQKCSIVGNVVNTVGRRGIRVDSSNCVIANNIIRDAGTATNNTYAGIFIDADQNHTITGNVITSEAANKIKYGIEEGATSNLNTIIGNNIEGAVTAPILVSGVDTIAKNNIGASTVSEKDIKYMKNTSGAAVAAGDVVVFKSVAAGNEFTTTTTAGDNKVFGMATAAISDTASGYIQVLGKTTLLKVNGTTDIAVGDYLATYTTAGIAYKATIGSLVAVGDTAFAIALEAYTGDDSNGVIDALIINPLKV